MSDDNLTKYELFQKYVMPYQRMNKSLCRKYTLIPNYADENYADVLCNLYQYIKTYDPSKDIRTWLHICTKRRVVCLDTRRKKQDARNDDKDIELFSNEFLDESDENYKHIDEYNYRDYMTDDILWALDKLKPKYRNSFVLQLVGYKLSEIAMIEFERGNLKIPNTETIKSRLFIARQFLMKYLDRDGNKRKAN